MADQTTLMGLLKTPSQIRKESQERLMQESLARSQMMLTRGGSTALPGIISAYGAQAAQRGTQAGAGLLRGVAGGIGQAVGGDMGQRISALGVPMEERQAREGQEALKGMNSNDPVSIRKAAERLRQLGLTQASAQLEAQATRVEEAKRKSDLEERRVRVAERRQEVSESQGEQQIEQAQERIDMQREQNQWTQEYRTSQLNLQQQGLDLRTNEFTFRKDQAGKISPVDQERINIAKENLALQRRKFEELSPYQQAQIEYQEKQIELAEQRIDLQSEQAQAQLADSKKRLQIQEAQLYGSFTKDSVDAWKESNGETALVPRPKATELPVPKELNKNIMRDFDAAAAQAQLEGKIESSWTDDITDAEKKRVIYKEALRIQRIMRDLTDVEALEIAIATVTGSTPSDSDDTSTTTGSPDLSSVTSVATGEAN